MLRIEVAPVLVENAAMTDAFAQTLRARLGVEVRRELLPA